MKRRQHDDSEVTDHDSFLDIVANIVGILIILVMVVGVRAGDAPVLAISAAPEIDLAAPQQTIVALQHDIHKTEAQSLALQGTIQGRQLERDQLATVVAEVERAIQDRRGSLDARAQAEFDLRRQLNEGRDKLARVSRQRAEIEAAPKRSVEVKSYPTPLSKKVFGREIHFQIRNSLIAYLPIDALFETAKEEAREKVWKLDGLPEATELIGPVEGFRMRYTLEKIEVPARIQIETGRGGYLIRAKRWELIPTASRLGESQQQALTPGSRFDRVLRRIDPARTTITLWVYPESFDVYRRLKEELFKRGYATAGRPLPRGTPIGGSPQGTRSNAQ